jgi:hypothetical protein
LFAATACFAIAAALFAKQRDLNQQAGYAFVYAFFLTVPMGIAVGAGAGILTRASIGVAAAVSFMALRWISEL